MRVRYLDLEGYRCFEAASVSFDPGVTVIHGPNGSGKTTLLESILFALYGARALDDATLADVMTKGAEETVVSLDFTHDGAEYVLERELVRRDDRAATRSCTLTGPMSEPIEGARPVRRRIRELLRMDAEAFVNSVYVKQGEINKLLRASPAERRAMLDELLQLGRLDTYRERADEARLAVQALTREHAERLDELEGQRERLAEDDPYRRLNELESDRERLLEEEGALEERAEELRTRRDELEGRLEAVEEAHDRLDRLRERRDELTAAIEETRGDRVDLREAIADRRDELEAARTDVEDRRAALGLDPDESVEDAVEAVEAAIEEVEEELEAHRSAIEEHRSTLAELRERRDAVRDRIADREGELERVGAAIEEDEAVIEERRDELDRIDAAVEEAAAALPCDPPEGRDAVADRLEALEGDREARRSDLQRHRERAAALADHVEQAEDLMAAERCPTCGQPIDDAPHVERVEEERELLEAHRSAAAGLEDDLATLGDRIEALEAIGDALERRTGRRELLEERRDALEDRRERRESLRSAVDDLREEEATLAERIEAAEATLEEAKAEVADCNARLGDRRDRRGELEALADAIDRRDDLEDEIDRLRERRDHLETLQDERREQLADVEDRLAAVRDDLGDVPVDELEAEHDAVAEDLETVREERETLAEERDRLNERIGSVRTDLEALERLEDRIDAVDARRERLAGLREEVASLGDVYEAVRADLRERNVATLEHLLNETFDRLYRNEAYDRIDLGSDYSLSIAQKDGTPLDPMDLSGGERAVFNLSLRCAIYRLLAEGVDGAAPMPPLLLDEPTVFLDEGHVGRLVRLLEAMRELGVEQTLVVSHHETLLDAADHRVAVEKDPTTNRSSVERPALELAR